MKVRVRFHFDTKDLPTKGVYISNHLSFLDPIILFAFLPGNPIFAMHGQIYRNRWIRFLMKTADMVEYSNIDPMALKDLITKVKSGRFVMIFPEGRISDNGGLMKIYESAGLLADKADAPVIPIWINGAQFSYFSKTKGKLPHRPFPRIRVSVGEPKPLKLQDELRRQRDHISNEIYMILREHGFQSVYNKKMTLFKWFVKTAKIYGKKGFSRAYVYEDIQRKPQTYRDVIIKSYVLGHAIKKRTSLKEPVGVILPNLVATVCTFLGMNAYGRIPVMINFSAGLENVLSMCRTVQLKKIITSHAFVKNGGLEELMEGLKAAGLEIIYLEDMAKKISLWEKINGLLRYKIKRIPYKAKGSDTAVILFTSGSEGMPKAVVLTHNNLVSNILQIISFQTLDHTDIVFNSLPMFHSLGLVVCTFFGPMQGAKVFLYPSPLHFRIITELLNETSATVMIATDTFYRSYAKISHPFDFSRLKLCYAGGEGVKLDTRNLLSERLGKRLMEAYGTTECSPVVTVNNLVFNKFGTIGKLAPGMECKLEPVDGIETGGELCVKGPNVMAGYILPENPGVLVPVKDGWYHTGDVVDIDEIGFIKIKDRIKRFAKIGGEMVSLAAVENMVRKAIGEFKEGVEIGVVSVPHETKGEQIVVVTNQKEFTLEELKNYARQNSFPELYIPRLILSKAKLPVFATGKTDNVTLKKDVMAELNITNPADQKASACD